MFVDSYRDRTFHTMVTTTTRHRTVPVISTRYDRLREEYPLVIKKAPKTPNTGTLPLYDQSEAAKPCETVGNEIKSFNSDDQGRI